MEWWSWTGLAVLAGAVFVAATAAHVAFWRRVLAIERRPDESLQVPTADGWRLPLYRYRPAGGPRAQTPVILCHGLGVNHLNLDYPAPHGLAAYLAAAGHDVFVLSLRGTGRAEAPPDARPIDFDQFCGLDAPAVIAEVRARTGAERVAWVGHSMGGMIAYALGGTEAGRALACFVAVGSPSGFAHQPRLSFLARHLGWLAGLTPVPALPARIAAPWSGFFTPPFLRPIVKPGAIDGRVIRRFLAHGIERIPASLLRQFARWAADDRFCSADGALDYRARMAEHRVPALLLSGSLDGLVPPACVAAAHARLGSTTKHVEELGLARGFLADYGHGDLLLGRTAPSEVFPRIAAFLRTHAP